MNSNWLKSLLSSPNWFTSMFSGSPGSQDVIKAGPTNATKITAFIGVIATAVAAASKTLFGTDGPLSKLTPGEQEGLWLGVLAFVTVLIVADLVVRGFVTARVSAAQENAPVVWFNPVRRATGTPGSNDPGGLVVAMRKSSDDASGIQYFVVRDPDPKATPAGATLTAWVGASLLNLDAAPAPATSAIAATVNIATNGASAPTSTDGAKATPVSTPAAR